ncbi:MAG: hypothetical protein DME25_06610, partial [Verrucomicrobia bacterium]
MTPLRTIFTLGLCWVALPWAGRAQPEPAWEITPYPGEGLVEYDFATHLAHITNGMMVRYAGAILTADEATVNEQTGEVIADGTVRIQRDDQIWAGEHIRYNFKTLLMEAEQFRTGKALVFAAGQGLRADLTNQVAAATDALITGDDVAQPAIKVRAKYIKIIPGKKIEAHNATLYLGGVPVFYFPFYSRNLGPRANNFNFTPGYRSSYGPFVLGNYTWFLNEALDGTAHVDYRERRGVGAGPDLNAHLGRWGEATLKYYYLHDNDPGASSTNAIPDNRQRVHFSYLATPFTNLSVRSLVRYQSDSAVVRDFFERDYA